MSRLRTLGAELSQPISTASSSRYSRPKRAAWEWVLQSAIQSSRATMVEFGSLPARLTAPFFTLNYRLNVSWTMRLLLRLDGLRQRDQVLRKHTDDAAARITNVGYEEEHDRYNDRQYEKEGH